MIRQFSLISCSALVIILYKEGICILVFILGCFFFFFLVNFERFHRGNRLFPHNLHSSKLHVVVISRDFIQISCSYQVINLNLQRGQNATGSNGEPWKAYAGLSINPSVCSERTQKGHSLWEFAVLPLRAGRGSSPSRLGATATLCLEAPLSCEMSPAPTPARAY